MATYDVTTYSQLVAAITAANNSVSDDTIYIDGSIKLTGPLPLINKLNSDGSAPNSGALTITGKGAGGTVSGADAYQIFAIDSGVVTVSNLALVDGYAHGQNGVSGQSAGGGGGLGGGAALLVNSGAVVSLDKVAFNNNRAVGGDGGDRGVAGAPTVGGGGHLDGATPPITIAASDDIGRGGDGDDDRDKTYPGGYGGGEGGDLQIASQGGAAAGAAVLALGGATLSLSSTVTGLGNSVTAGANGHGATFGVDANVGFAPLLLAFGDVTLNVPTGQTYTPPDGFSVGRVVKTGGGTLISNGSKFDLQAGRLVTNDVIILGGTVENGVTLDLNYHSTVYYNASGPGDPGSLQLLNFGSVLPFKGSSVTLEGPTGGGYAGITGFNVNGTLKVDLGVVRLGAGSYSNDLIVTNGASAQLGYYDITPAHSITLGDATTSGVLAIAGYGDPNTMYSVDTTLNVPITVNAGGGTLQTVNGGYQFIGIKVSGAISGPGALTISSARSEGAVTPDYFALQAANTFGGGLILASGGGVALGAAGAAGTGTITFTPGPELLILTSAYLGTDAAHTAPNTLVGFAADGDTIRMSGASTGGSASYDAASHRLILSSGGAVIATVPLTGDYTGAGFNAIESTATGVFSVTESSAGDDTIQVGAFYDTVDGGAGTDTAVYLSPFAHYQITFGSGSTVFLDVTASGQAPAKHDVLTNVEVLRFADRIVDLSVSGSLTVAAGLPVSLLTPQSYTGKTQIYGELDLASGGSVASSSQVALKASGAVFDVSGASAAGAVTIQALSGVAGSMIRLGAGALSLTESVAATYAGAISDGGIAGGVGGGLVINGSAPLTLTGVDTYTGKTQIYGQLDLAGWAVLNQSKAVTLKSASAVFDISGATGKEAILNVAGVAGSHIHLGANALKINDTTAATFAGIIADGGAVGGTGGSLIVKGTVPLALTGANTFTGGVTLLSGVLELGTPTAAGVGHALTFSGGATLQLDAGALAGSGAQYSYGTAIAGFAAGDHVDLASLTYAAGATAMYDGSTLTVTSSGSSVALTLSGPAASAAFTVADDGHGHVLVGLVGAG